MKRTDVDSLFAGSVPRFYEEYLVPLAFEPYAADLAERVARSKPSRVLEVAAGTGVVTRHLTRLLGPEAKIVATDLNQPMLDQAAAIVSSPSVEWRQADALELPFEDGAFDAVACQFGVMFFADKPRAFAEARRVLRPGGRFVFNVWDRIADNEFFDVVTESLAVPFAQDPPRFFARVPYGYFNAGSIAQDLAAGGFTAAPLITTLPARSRAESALAAATALCQGTPLRNEIEARGSPTLAESTRIAAEALARRFGRSAIEGRIQALVVEVER